MLIAHRKTKYFCWQSAARPYFRVFYVTYRYAGIAPWNRVCGKLVIPQLVQKFTAFYINQQFRYRIHKMLSSVQIYGHVTPVHTHPVTDLFQYYLLRGLPSGIVPCGFPTKLCIHLLSLWCVQDASPTSSLVWSPWSYLTRTTSPEASHVFFAISLLCSFPQPQYLPQNPIP